jgi:hypothetical protein
MIPKGINTQSKIIFIPISVGIKIFLNLGLLSGRNIAPIKKGT